MADLSTLRNLGARWRQCLLDVGKELLRLEADGVPLVQMFGLLHDEFGMTEASAKVAYRWAKGEFGDESTATMVVSKVRHSVLADMAETTVKTLATKPVKIISDENRVQQKRLADMSKREASRNIGVIGALPIEKQVKTEAPSVRQCIGNAVRVEESGHIVIVGTGREPVEMRLSAKAIRELREALQMESQEAVCAA